MSRSPRLAALVVPIVMLCLAASAGPVPAGNARSGAPTASAGNLPSRVGTPLFPSGGRVEPGQEVESATTGAVTTPAAVSRPSSPVPPAVPAEAGSETSWPLRVGLFVLAIGLGLVLGLAQRRRRR
ncbi:hypothetical protein [Amycolatopsis samaneae]|uniref:MYXO-CTERM domain-containing protein n=1 Tax=Amycolatopsis samaneae TaxID=664691 RepID=A0ABW5GR97_9PSEU